MTVCASEQNIDLQQVHSLIGKVIGGTSMAPVVRRLAMQLGGGKMLRAQLILTVGAAVKAPRPILCSSAAVVEMLHAASLLHDDVVDGADERRNEPALWVTEGTKAAVLVGDLLISHAVGMMLDARPQAVPMLVTTLQEMCNGEVEQEFKLAVEDDPWEQAVRIARLKTGSLFGFAAFCAAGGDTDLAERLRQAGYKMGTAYQLADDLLDASDGEWTAGKTLGTDAAAGKLTGASATPPAGGKACDVIDSLLRESEAELAGWPPVEQAWRKYSDGVIRPLVARFTAPAAVEAII